MIISFHGAVGCVTGSCYLVTCGKSRFLVDCGMFQGNKVLKQLNYREFPFDPASINFVLLTHAHIDHVGLLPKLVKKGFKGPIYATTPTVDFVKLLLPDSARIQQSEVELKNRRSERKGVDVVTPIYDEADADAACKLLKGVSLDKESRPTTGVSVVFRNAGHIFGSSFIEITLQEDGKSKKIVFSGDIGCVGHPIVKDPEFFSDADYLLIESTYGNRIRENDSNEDRLKMLADAVNGAVTKKGNLIIPSFALERTQDLMHDLTILIDRGSIAETEVVIDSPLAIDATKVYAKFPEFLDEEATTLLKKQGKLFDNGRFRFSKSSDESKQLNNESGKIILSASGMCDAGRIKHHLKHNLWRRDSTVLFVGFQAEGTLGRMLLEGAKSVRIHGEEIKVEAKIVQIMGYSGHADQNGLFDWLKPVTAIRDRIFVVHGEDDSRTEFARLLEERRGFKVETPGLDSGFDLLAVKECIPATLIAGLGKVAPAIVPAAKPAPTGVTPPVAPPRRVPIQPQMPKRDSYNLYADLSLRLADFMRRTTDEESRRKALETLLAGLPRGS
ncbi:MAG: MBL fold metallo-hydrolase [Candidatus Riflebacteria bacterium]|nr:MBL fold metallo-hydrolase [Candidatus Riflebacteria bacterium]